MRWGVAFAIGVLFAVGLALGGMTDSARVIGFLDLTGDWDPSLLFVMGGAIAVFAPAWQLSRRIDRPLLAATFPSNEPQPIDARLLGGAALFGVGWGLAGLCPAPALVVSGAGLADALVFVAAMVVGAWAIR